MSNVTINPLGREETSRVKNADFHRKNVKLTPELMAARAEAIEADGFELTEKIDPYSVANVLDKKLQKTEKGRKFVAFLASGATFAAAVVSFKKVAPKLRAAIGHATANVAKKFSSSAKDVKVIKEVADEVAQNGEKIANGTGDGLQKLVNKVAGENADKVLNGLEKIGVKNGGDAADLAIAGGAAVLAGREAGDIAQDKQEKATIGGVLQDIAKVTAAFSGAADV